MSNFKLDFFKLAVLFILSVSIFSCSDKKIVKISLSKDNTVIKKIVFYKLRLENYATHSSKNSTFPFIAFDSISVDKNKSYRIKIPKNELVCVSYCDSSNSNYSVMFDLLSSKKNTSIHIKNIVFEYDAPYKIIKNNPFEITEVKADKHQAFITQLQNRNMYESTYLLTLLDSLKIDSFKKLLSEQEILFFSQKSDQFISFLSSEDLKKMKGLLETFKKTKHTTAWNITYNKYKDYIRYSDTAGVKSIEVLDSLGTPIQVNIPEDSLTVVHFWATWCRPCIADIPEIEKDSLLYRDKKIRWVNICLQEIPYGLKRFRKEHHFAGEHYLIDFRKEALINQRFNITKYPSYFVYRQGIPILSSGSLEEVKRIILNEK